MWQVIQCLPPYPGNQVTYLAWDFPFDGTQHCFIDWCIYQKLNTNITTQSKNACLKSCVALAQTTAAFGRTPTQNQLSRWLGSRVIFRTTTQRDSILGHKFSLWMELWDWLLSEWPVVSKVSKAEIYELIPFIDQTQGFQLRKCFKAWNKRISPQAMDWAAKNHTQEWDPRWETRVQRLLPPASKFEGLINLGLQ